MKSKTLRNLLSCFLLVLILSGCGSDKKVESISFSQDETELLTTDTLEVTAVVLPEQVDKVSLSWKSSDEDVFTVDGTKRTTDNLALATITPVAPGKAELTVTTANGKTDVCVITVRDPVVPERITLSQTKMELIIGESSTLTVTLAPKNVDDDTVVLESSDPDVVNVSGFTVTAVSPGEATVTAIASNGKTAECKVTAREFRPVTSVDAGSDITLLAGEEKTLVPKFVPENADDKSYTVTSADETIVSVSENKLTANAPGTTTVRVTASNGVSDEVNVTVRDPEEVKAEQYSRFTASVDSGDYSSALTYFNTSKLTADYKDVSDYYNYAQAMKLYKQTEFLKFADIKKVVELLGNVSDGFKDASDVAESISASLDHIIGTHCYIKWPNLADHGLDDSLFLVVNNDGSAVLDFGMSSKGKPNSDYAMYVLVYVNLEKASYFMLADDIHTDIDHCLYGIIETSKNEIVLSSAWGDTRGTWKGNYKKVG